MLESFDVFGPSNLLERDFLAEEVMVMIELFWDLESSPWAHVELTNTGQPRGDQGSLTVIEMGDTGASS